MFNGSRINLYFWSLMNNYAVVMFLVLLTLFDAWTCLLK